VARQKQRVLPVIERLHAALDEAGFEDVFLSIDTTQSAVADAALDAGATMINDVSAGREDPGLLDVAGQRHVPIALMHMLGAPATMQDNPQYDDVVREVETFLRERVDAAVTAGVEPSQVVIDPGIGFGKTVAHNLRLLRQLDHFVAIGQPVLLGASRKRFIASVSEVEAETPGGRLGGTCAVTAWAVQQGVQICRVHDVAPNRQAADVAMAMHRGS